MGGGAGAPAPVIKVGIPPQGELVTGVVSNMVLMVLVAVEEGGTKPFDRSPPCLLFTLLTLLRHSVSAFCCSTRLKMPLP